MSLKHLGFSLDDIKNRLIPLDTPAEIADVLMEQAAIVRQKIESLSESLRELELLREEVLQMQSVDFKKYADIIINLEMKNDFYLLIKHFDSETLDHIRSRFDKESSITFLQKFLHIQDEAIRLQDAGVSAGSPEGLQLAKAYWDLILEFTGGDAAMLPTLMRIGENDEGNQERRQKHAKAKAFIEPALGAYFLDAGIHPFQ